MVHSDFLTQINKSNWTRVEVLSVDGQRKRILKGINTFSVKTPWLYCCSAIIGKFKANCKRVKEEIDMTPT